MNKWEVIDELSKNATVERIVYKLLPCSKNPFDYPQDLIQDIYLILLNGDENLIVALYNKGELGFYILRIARNQLLSKNSPYYTKYIKFSAQSDEINKAANTITTEDRGRVC